MTTCHSMHSAYILKCTFQKLLLFTTKYLDIKRLNILLQEEYITICNTDVKEKRIVILLQAFSAYLVDSEL